MCVCVRRLFYFFVFVSSLSFFFCHVKQSVCVLWAFENAKKIKWCDISFEHLLNTHTYIPCICQSSNEMIIEFTIFSKLCFQDASHFSFSIFPFIFFSFIFNQLKDFDIFPLSYFLWIAWLCCCYHSNQMNKYDECRPIESLPIDSGLDHRIMFAMVFFLLFFKNSIPFQWLSDVSISIVLVCLMNLLMQNKMRKKNWILIKFSCFNKGIIALLKTYFMKEVKLRPIKCYLFNIAVVYNIDTILSMKYLQYIHERELKK